MKTSCNVTWHCGRSRCSIRNALVFSPFWSEEIFSETQCFQVFFLNLVHHKKFLVNGSFTFMIQRRMLRYSVVSKILKCFAEAQKKIYEGVRQKLRDTYLKTNVLSNLVYNEPIVFGMKGSKKAGIRAGLMSFWYEKRNGAEVGQRNDGNRFEITSDFSSAETKETIIAWQHTWVLVNEKIICSWEGGKGSWGGGAQVANDACR